MDLAWVMDASVGVEMNTRRRKCISGLGVLGGITSMRIVQVSLNRTADASFFLS